MHVHVVACQLTPKTIFPRELDEINLKVQRNYANAVKIQSMSF